MIEGIGAVKLGTHEMYRGLSNSAARLGLRSCVATNNRHSPAFRAGMSYLNLIAQPAERAGPGGGA